MACLLRFCCFFTMKLICLDCFLPKFMLELVLPKYWSRGVEHCSINVICQTECNPVSLYVQEFDLEQKIDLEIKMREGTTKLLAACRHQTQTLEAAKSLLTSNERMSAYMAELQRRKRDLPPRPLGWVSKSKLYNTNQCKSTLSLNINMETVFLKTLMVVFLHYMLHYKYQKQKSEQKEQLFIQYPSWPHYFILVFIN